jgi:hypothetical protein
MSSNSSDAALIATLNILSAELNRYLSIVILLFGTIGNVLNCLALSQRTLRSNPCALLFLASSITNLVTLVSGVAVRLLAGWSADLTNTVGSLCKLRIFVLFASRTIASWLITLATIDRWFCSSIHARRRQMSSLKNARRGIILIVCFSSLVYAQIFYCYEANLINTPLMCYGKTVWCQTLIDSEFTFISVIIPSTLMFVFGLMTIINVRKSTLRRVQPTTMTITVQGTNMNGGARRSRKTDHHLLIMLFMQVILLTLFSLPQAIQNLYSNITMYFIKDLSISPINDFIFNLFFLLTYVTNGMPFYIYTLTGGTTFRKALLDALREIKRKIIYRGR